MVNGHAIGDLRVGFLQNMSCVLQTAGENTDTTQTSKHQTSHLYTTFDKIKDKEILLVMYEVSDRNSFSSLDNIFIHHCFLIDLSYLLKAGLCVRSSISHGLSTTGSSIKLSICLLYYV